MKICLIGSSRFAEKYQEVNSRLTLSGHLVYSIAMLSSQVRSAEITPEQKTILDLVHLRKIQESDAVVLITDESGYYGESTSRELIWAEMNGKPLLFPEDDLRNFFLDSDWIKAKASGNPELIRAFEAKAREEYSRFSLRDVP